MNLTDALVQPMRSSVLCPEDKRASVRHACSLEATSQPLDDAQTIAWGAMVDDISEGGLGIILCYPFRPGTYLAIDLTGANGDVRTVLVRVVHVRDRADGTWHLGCEFVKPLTESDVEMLI